MAKIVSIQPSLANQDKAHIQGKHRDRDGSVPKQAADVLLDSAKGCFDLCKFHYLGFELRNPVMELCHLLSGRSRTVTIGGSGLSVAPDATEAACHTRTMLSRSHQFVPVLFQRVGAVWSLKSLGLRVEILHNHVRAARQAPVAHYVQVVQYQQMRLKDETSAQPQTWRPVPLDAIDSEYLCIIGRTRRHRLVASLLPRNVMYAPVVQQGDRRGHGLEQPEARRASLTDRAGMKSLVAVLGITVLNRLPCGRT